MGVKEKMTAIADKIRMYLNSEAKYSLDSMPEAIYDVFSRGVDKGEAVAKSKPYLDTSQLTNFRYFCMGGIRQEAIPFLDTSNGTNFNGMFQSCGNLTTVPFLDTSKGTDFGEMFYYCNNLITVPALDTGNGTNFMWMFSSCSNLTTIPLLDISKGIDLYGMFDGCTALRNITFAGTIGQSLDMQYSPLNKASIESIISCLSTTATGKTLTLKKSAKEAAFTDEEWSALAGAKTNWTISLM